MIERDRGTKIELQRKQRAIDRDGELSGYVWDKEKQTKVKRYQRAREKQS